MTAPVEQVPDEVIDTYRALLKVNAHAKAQGPSYYSRHRRGRDVKRLWRKLGPGRSLKAWARGFVAEAVDAGRVKLVDGGNIAIAGAERDGVIVGLITGWLGAKS